MHPHSESLLRIARLPRRLPISRSAWWAGIKQNKYPADIKISPCVTLVMSGSIDELILQLAQLVCDASVRVAYKSAINFH